MEWGAGRTEVLMAQGPCLGAQGTGGPWTSVDVVGMCRCAQREVQQGPWDGFGNAPGAAGQGAERGPQPSPAPWRPPEHLSCNEPPV